MKQLNIFTTPEHDPAIAAAIKRQKAIALHYASLDIQALNRQCLAERKTRYLNPSNPFKTP
jgi:hypothetical protein